ncbi:S8 family serine peptidase [Sporosarcina luteola]|uniref:S8 family serine peptidase n=1 Tax=Sporosarcina luteola TaxID=582850 RepID=UPI003EB7AE19
MVFTLLAPMNVSANNGPNPFKQNGTNESIMQAKAAVAQQLNVLEGEPALHKDLQGLSGSEEVSVIIHLSEKPVALEKGIKELAGQKFTTAEANAVKSKVKAQHTFFKKEMNANHISFKEGFTFDTVLNGFSMTVKAADLEKILDIKGVTLIEPDVTVYALEDTSLSSEVVKGGQVGPAMDTSIGFLGIEALWAEGYEGQGIKVAVLDTGIDANHPEFQGIYKGGKNFIPNSSTYTRPRADDDASETSPVERPAGTPEFNANGSAFYTSHGTHVAGTIAAIGNNEYGIKGIAPKVDLYVYRVLGAYGSGATSGIVAAIDTAVVERMDVINLSLGGGSNTETDAGSFAINNAMLAGTISVIATGNSGPNRGTMGTPATSRLGIAVGNTTNPETKHNGKVNVTVGNYNLSKKINLMGTTFGKDIATQLEGEFELVAIPGNGEAKDYNGIDVEGKVALISRGSIAFVDKIAYAKENGAVATIIHNFAGGTNAPEASGTFLGDAFEFIPTYDMSQTDGDAIRAALKDGKGTVTFSDFDKTMTPGDEVNDSSSRGPSTPNFDIKPDVTAPGTNIMSTIPMYKADFPEATYDQAYTRKTGTSMATPHIAGIAALVKQANPNWNAFDVKVALSNSAKILNTEKYDVMAQGAGRVDAYAAAHSTILAYAQDKAVLDGSGEIVENLKGTVTFGPQKLDKDISVTKQILVKNDNGNGGTYNASVQVTKGFGDAKVTIDKPTFTLSGEQLLNVTLTASAASTKTGDEILGYIHITPAEENLTEVSLFVDKTELKMQKDDKYQLKVTEKTTQKDSGYTKVSLPFAADFGGATAIVIKDMRISETDLSFNGDGVKDEATLSFTLTGDVTTNYIELWDIMDPEGGEYGDGYIGYLHAGSALGAGSYTLAIKGQYKPWGSSPATTIPDGLYTIDFTGLSKTGVVGDYVGPIVVKTTKPEITGALASGEASGQVTDKYLDYNDELANYGLDFDLNEKLHASYVITRNGEKEQPVRIELEQDGSFNFGVPEVNEETDSVTVIVEDAAGNRGEQVIVDGSATIPDDVTEPEANESEPDELSEPGEPSDPGEPSQGASLSTLQDNGLSQIVKVANAPESFPTNTKVVAKDSEVDVTKVATYKSADEKIATVENGLVIAKAAGSTTITITYENHKAITVNVTVKDPAPNPGNGGGDNSGGGGYIPSTPTTPTPTPTTPTKPDPVKPDPVKPDPVKPEPMKPVTFTDVSKGYWAEFYIQKAVQMGIFKGYKDGSFKPNEQLTRAQAAALITRALGLQTNEAAPFNDIKNLNKETQAEIAAAYKYGIIKGQNGDFNHSESVTRVQLALMIARAYEYKTGEAYTPTAIAPFSDIGNYNKETVNAISMLYELKIITGSDGKFMPQDPTTRAQASKIFVNFMEFLQ